MKFVKIIFACALCLGAVFIAVAFFLPAQVHVERSLTIKASPEKIFPHINSLQAGAEWSPWSKVDPDMQSTFTGPGTGVGNRMEWQSDHPNVGSGTQEIIASEENRLVRTALEFGDMGNAEAEFTLSPVDGGTKVTWGFDTKLGMNPVARWMGLMFDSWIGADYEKGLQNLKTLIEG